ncbi:MAG: hypothetical protein F6K54_25795 [Okeania sp. SIO3B5]|uniref:hypothetical protein n=1 Tax=Okeania sp. SIO3B5 TaxID=2607811 RepID=UPI0013FF872B|nr:hypothetical protein [Okeania sp. SIO3B5]NEO56190.1 hypothetical protein [Okeania sp. SIO3B5]
MNNTKIRDFVLAGVVSTLVGGTLILATIDKDYRSSFFDLAKVGVGGYIALTIPKSNSEGEEAE